MKSRWASLTSGGTDLDVKRCWETYRNGDKTFQYQGAHMRTAGENRWCFHESLVHLAAIWVMPNCVPDIYTYVPFTL